MPQITETKSMAETAAKKKARSLYALQFEPIPCLGFEKRWKTS